MEALEVPEHEHPLKLIDLQLEYPLYHEEEEVHDDDDDDDDEGDDLIRKEVLHGVKCGRCCHEIHMYHRYYYKCVGGDSSSSSSSSSSCECDFSLHKFCAELSTRLDHTLHRHPLIQRQMVGDWSCRICKCLHKPLEMCYDCSQSECHFPIDVNCGVEVGKKIIHHPSHLHLLMCVFPKPILCECSACGKEHKGIFYQCTICSSFAIHNDCAFLPENLLIQHTTNHAFDHIHPLTVSYSFPLIDQKAKHDPKCRVCNHDFVATEDLWIYKYDKCLYYAHVGCTTPTSVRPVGAFRQFEVEDYDYEHPGRLLHLPFPDETYNIPKHLFSQETGTSDDHKAEHLTHKSHQHPLILVDHTRSNGLTSSSWLLKCHNPMKKTQLLCDGCLKPITATMPFYICANDDGGCNNFALHEWCTRLPTEIENHPVHPYHTLVLMYSHSLPFFFGMFYCNVCHLFCNGFAYGCVECGYYVDVTCGFMPEQISHKLHPYHILSITREGSRAPLCNMCHLNTSVGPFLFCCDMCGFFMHSRCAFLILEAIRHKYDEHPMQLSYLPIENHKSEYFCEICEGDLNPHVSFYHCKVCA
ncbi:uncharacterized protein LOC111898885 [Lactuca sativa]|uniref:uncharacterized protein LOC111898885 n=1 Tax=Lactuca sativa TaxID=4236 RepID=UPI000CD9052F|nr:uncharacterized protein LOC111898885 [Lactuca sativa]